MTMNAWSREETEAAFTAEIEQEARLHHHLCECCDQRVAIVMVEGDKLCDICRPVDAYTAEEMLAYYRSLIDGPHASDCASWVGEPCNCIVGKAL